MKIRHGAPVARTLKGIGGHITLKALSEYLELHPATVSVVLNDIPGRAVPAQTRRRIKEAAHKFGYVPNGLARSLRTGRTRNIGVIVPGLSHGPYASIMSSLGNRLTQSGYCYMALHRGHNPATVRQNIETLQMRGVEGIILINAMLDRCPAVPAVTIGCKGRVSGTAKIVFDEHRAVVLALEYFRSRGRKKISLLDVSHSDSDKRNLANITRKIAKFFNIELINKETAIDHKRLKPDALLNGGPAT